MLSRREDLELVRAFQANDYTVFDRLVIKYQDMVFNLCYRMLGDYDEANDRAQETFIKAYRNLKNFKSKSSFSTWIYRIAINTCRNYLSSSVYRMNKKMIRLDNPGNTSLSMGKNSRAIDVYDNSSDPSRVFEKKEKERVIQKAIDSLPSKQKILIVLRDIEDKSYEEISEITTLKIGTVKSRLSRARQHLRRKLGGVI